MLKMTKPAEDYESEYHQIERELKMVERITVTAMAVLICVGAFAWTVL